MTDHAKLDSILRILEQQEEKHSAFRKESREKMQVHGETLARLDERSIGAERRMNWIQKKAGGISAITASIISFLASWIF
jgi:flagellar biosynthesis chaperone FliJ